MRSGRLRMELLDRKISEDQLHFVAVLGLELRERRQHPRAEGTVKIGEVDDRHRCCCRAFGEGAVRGDLGMEDGRGLEVYHHLPPLLSPLFSTIFLCTLMYTLEVHHAPCTA
jgi:hypothetical protein